MRISELSQLTGVAASAIRYYEERDMFSPGQIVRRPNGYRDYTDAAHQRLRLILAGRAAGFSLQQMRTQMENWPTMSPPEKAEILTTQIDVIDRQIDALRESRAVIAAALSQLPK